MSQPVSKEDLEYGLVNRVKELERIVAELRSNQNQVQEIRIPGHPQHTDRWTQSNTYEDVMGSVTEIDFDKYERLKWRFEMKGFVDGGTGFWKLVNVTDSVDISGSEISTTVTDANNPDLIVSGVLPKPTGVKRIKIQHKQTGGSGSDFVNSVMSTHLFSFD